MTSEILPRVVLHGFYGAGNLGDEAILAGILRGLREGLGDFEAFVVSVAPESTERDHRVRAVHRHDLHGIANLLEQSHALVFGGGGLCNDYWPIRSADVLDDAWGSLAYYLRLPLLANLVDVPVEVFGQGVGPLNDPVARRQVGFVFSQAAHVNVRDRGSAALLEELGVGPPIEVAPDPAFLVRADGGAGRDVLIETVGDLDAGPLIGLSVRRAPSISFQMLEGLAEGVARFASEIDGRVVLLPFSRTSGSDDVELCQELASTMNCSTSIVEAEASPEVMLDLVSNLDLLVAMRLHATLFGIASSVPVIPVSYDPKVAALAADAGLQHLSTNAVDSWTVRTRLREDWQRRASIREQLAGAAEAGREGARNAANGLCGRLLATRERLAVDPTRSFVSLWRPGDAVVSARSLHQETRAELVEARESIEVARAEVTAIREREKALERRHADNVRGLEEKIASAHERFESIRAVNHDLKRKLAFARQEGREVAGQLQEIWESPYWKLLNLLMSNNLVRFGWRATPRFVKNLVKKRIEKAVPLPPEHHAAATVASRRDAGTMSTAAPDTAPPQAGRSTAQVFADLEEFLERVDRGTARDLTVFVAGVKYVENEGQRVTQIIREFIGEGMPVLLLYFRWQSEYQDPVPESDNPALFQLPIDLFDTRRKTLVDYPFRSDLRRTFIIEFPYPATFQWVNEFNLAGWRTVYDIIDDWEEFHEAGKAVWYEAAVEHYLCRNAGAVTAIVPLLEEKVATWLPDRKVTIVPNGVSPESFDFSVDRKELPTGDVTVGYFGYLAQAWFDWQLVADTARARPSWVFHIIGYGEEPAAELPGNVHLLGKVPHHLLYAFSQNWDVGIVPFKPTTLSKGADPIKVYEYLTLGLPVVAADIPHLREYPGVFVASSAEEFLAHLETAAAQPFPEAEVKAFLDQSTWLQRGLSLLEAPHDLEAGASLVAGGVAGERS